MANRKKSAAAYMRYSSDNQNENSIEYQRRAIVSYCLQHSIELEEEYVDEAFSATSDKRPSFQKLITDAKNNPVWNMILVYDLSRFARNNSDAVKYTNMLEDSGIELVSITQEFGNGNEGFLLKGLTHLMNEFYSRNNSKHTHAGMKSKAQQGIHCGGKPPLGYNVDATGHLVINDAEAEIVKLVFNMYELNYSYSKMADILNNRGYCNKNSKPFSKFSFNSILRQEKYRGTYVWNKTKAKDSNHRRNTHKHKPIEQQVVIENGCPAIISQQQFERVQKKLADKNSSNKSSAHYMLSGLKILVCGECGSYMTGLKRISHGREYTTYYCPKHRNHECSMKEIPAKHLDNLVANVLAANLYHRKDLDEISACLNNSHDYAIIKNKIRGNKKATSNIMKAMGQNYLPELAEELKELSNERAILNQIISEYESGIKTINEDNIKDIAISFKKCLIKSDIPEVKMYLKEHVEQIIVSKDDVTFSFNIA